MFSLYGTVGPYGTYGTYVVPRYKLVPPRGKSVGNPSKAYLRVSSCAGRNVFFSRATAAEVALTIAYFGDMPCAAFLHLRCVTSNFGFYELSRRRGRRPAQNGEPFARIAAA